MSNPVLQRAVLQEADMAVTLLNYGAITRGWTIGGVPMVQSLPTDADYLADRFFTGIIAGRVANRTANGRFTLHGHPHQLSQNDGPNHLHGGIKGLGKRFWQMDQNGPRAVRFLYHSPDGEEGYPGAVDFTVDITLSNQSLIYDIRATPDRPTPINIAQHSYYTLGGTRSIWGATLMMNADRVTVAGTDGIPQGSIEPVTGTDFDFRQPQVLTAQDARLDDNVLFMDDRALDRPVATLHANGFRLRMWSDQCGAQIYTGAHLPEPNTALCIEPQAPPNAVNQPDLPSIIATPEHPYRQVLRVEICKVAA